MLIVSIAKRMQGDEMNMHSSSNASVSKVVELVNMRKYYTMTVSRFAWSTQDLAARYNAQCPDTGGKCQGITAPLTKKSTNATDEVLLVGKNVLQGKDLPIYTYQFTTLWTPLIQWNQPVAFAHPSATDSMLPTYVDMILPRHFKKSTFNPTAVYDDTSKSYACNPVAELRMQFIETNKLYMEHPLQPTYTAAVFYLLQNGAVRKTMPLDGTNLTTLQLDNNKQRMALRASTPRINGIVTLAGCAIVAAVSLSILIGKGYFARRIRSQLAPHTVARVLLNGSAYPSAVMQCVVGPSNQMKPLKDFHVRDVVLTDKDNNSVTLKAAAVTKK
ncbi:TPA: hypothetical protein N0F65_007134 [Lagenidium giganteum]|uniref:Uncharacterized protein n=1 Tax=Lagenidium giganteum TaxID=4803 RepID=A0AAV2YUH6_9STRA|nr:TPA: hypothetical protein N0F65_007134 [Lagenidium giganteum]